MNQTSQWKSRNRGMGGWATDTVPQSPHTAAPGSKHATSSLIGGCSVVKREAWLLPPRRMRVHPRITGEYLVYTTACMWRRLEAVACTSSSLALPQRPMIRLCRFPGARRRLRRAERWVIWRADTCTLCTRWPRRRDTTYSPLQRASPTGLSKMSKAEPHTATLAAPPVGPLRLTTHAE